MNSIYKNVTKIFNQCKTLVKDIFKNRIVNYCDITHQKIYVDEKYWTIDPIYYTGEALNFCCKIPNDIKKKDLILEQFIRNIRIAYREEYGDNVPNIIQKIGKNEDVNIFINYLKTFVKSIITLSFFNYIKIIYKWRHILLSYNSFSLNKIILSKLKNPKKNIKFLKDMVKIKLLYNEKLNNNLKGISTI